LRGDVLATNYGLINLGLGVGSTIAGIVLAVSPNAFRPLFVVDAITYLSFAIWLWRLGELRRTGAAAEMGPEARTGYTIVIRDRALLAATGLNLLLVTAGYAQLTSAFPAWATGPAGVSKSIVGFAFAANTWAIAVAQLPILAYVRTRYVAVYSTSWQIGPMIGPAIAGVALGAGAGGALLVGLAAACALAWPAAVLCERIVPASANLAAPVDAVE